MYVKFINNSESEVAVVHVQKFEYTVEPKEYVDIFFSDEKVSFVTEWKAFDKLTDDFDTPENMKFKERIIHSLAKKFAEKFLKRHSIHALNTN